MAVHISVFLFSKPAHELDKEGEEISGADVRALAEEMHQRLLHTAEVLDKLTAHGWEATMMLYDVALSHPYINTEAEARDRIADLGIDPDRICFMEFEDEEEWDEEEEFEEEFGEGEFEEEENNEAGLEP
jgi:hypothetical protein